MMKRLFGAAVGCAILVSTAAYAAGYFPGFPIVGQAAYCTGYSVYSQSVTVPGTLPTPNQCNSTSPAGPTTLTGTELLPLDTEYANGVTPQTALLPASQLGTGYGGTVVNTTTGTGQNPVVADGISTYVYAGAGTATFATLTLPPNPMQNQKFCLSDAGTGILTLTSIVVGTTGQTIVGTTPTSLPVATAVGTAGTVTLSTNCWQYVASSKIWYRVL